MFSNPRHLPSSYSLLQQSGPKLELDGDTTKTILDSMHSLIHLAVQMIGAHQMPSSPFTV